MKRGLRLLLSLIRSIYRNFPFTIYHSPFTLHHLLFTRHHHSSFTIYPSPFTIYRILPFTRHHHSPFTCLLIITCLSIVPAYAADDPFTGPANYGGTGLMETPTARIMKEGRFRIGVGQVDPYRYYYGAISPFSFLEIDGRVTEAVGFPAGDMSKLGYGSDKDKAVDLKFQFLKEGKYWPALALGIMDPQGTRLFASQYIVASKQFYPFDITIGFGNGRYGKKPLPSLGETMRLEIFQDNTSWRTDGQFFGGIQFAMTDSVMFMAEYNPIKYENGSIMAPGYFTSPVPSKFNFGLRWKPWDWLEADLSYQRGNQIGVNVSMAFDLGIPIIPIYDRNYREKQDLRSSPLAKRITAALEDSGFSNIGIKIEDGDLWIEVQNDKYYYAPKAFGKILRELAGVLGYFDSLPQSPDEDKTSRAEFNKIHLLLSENGVPAASFTTTAADVAAYYNEHFTLQEFLYLSKFTTDTRNNLDVKHTNRHWWDWGLKPSFQTLLNDPSGFFKYRLGASGWVSLNPWRGGSLVAGLEGYPINNISSSNTPSSQPVRTDAWLYKKESANMGLLLYEQIEKFPYQIYGKIAGGYLEVEYGGLDAEIAKPLFNGRLMVGLSGSVVKKREVDNIVQFKRNDWKDYYNTGFFNTRINIPELETAIDLKTGQFLAGDRGTRITISKSFNGVVLSLWWSFTDTSMFKDSFNNGYHDKGIAISIPLRMFKGSDSRTAYSFGVSPWTRDVAADIDHFTGLFDYIGRNTGIYLDKDAQIKGHGFAF